MNRALTIESYNGTIGKPGSELHFVETVYALDGGRGAYGRVTVWSNGHVDAMIHSDSYGGMVDAWEGQKRTARNAHALIRRLVSKGWR